MEKKDQNRKQDPKKKNNNHSKEKGSPLKDYARYTGMGFQMLVIIVIFVWAGNKLDEHMASEKPIFTAIFAVVGVLVGLYTSLRDFIGKKNDGSP